MNDIKEHQLTDILENLEEIGQWFNKLEAIFEMIEQNWAKCRMALDTMGEAELAAHTDQLINQFSQEFNEMLEPQTDILD